MMTAQAFGGDWTELKLQKLRQYLAAYTTALKKQPFNKVYIDAFAGTGFRRGQRDEEQPALDLPGLDQLLLGSAAAALEVEPSFDSYIFIEKNRSRFRELKTLNEKYPDKRAVMTFVQADANDALLDICGSVDWRRNRAVLFLDPFGTQVMWRTLEVVAATQAIDMWVLFPVGMGVDRMLPKHGNVPESWQQTLDRMLGDRGWREVFYSKNTANSDLFGDPVMEIERQATPKAIEEYFLTRLKTAFAAVGDHGLPLFNSKRYLMYLLCFACGNPNGARIAKRIASHLLKP